MHKLLLWIVCIQILPFRTLILPRELELLCCCVLAKSPQRYQRTILGRLESVIIIHWKMLLASSLICVPLVTVKTIKIILFTWYLPSFEQWTSIKTVKSIRFATILNVFRSKERALIDCSAKNCEDCGKLLGSCGRQWRSVNSHRLDDYDAAIFECSISASLFLFTTVQ